MNEFRTEFNIALQNWFEEKKQVFKERGYSLAVFDKLFLATQDLCVNGGKRVRPYLASLFATSVSKDGHIFEMRPFLALELFHVFGLVHDDIIDEGDTRRGVPTLHKVGEQFFSEQGRLGRGKKYGESLAILMGDLVFTWVQELIVEANIPADKKQKIQKIFANMASDVLLGQILDADLMSREDASFDLIYKKMFLKTASYTFVYPLQIGIVLSVVVDEKLLEFAKEFGTALGIAFQIQDDIFDAFLSQEQLGKTPLRDMTDGQPTYLTQYIIEFASEEQKKQLKQFFRKPIVPEDIPALQNLFRDSGALDYAQGEQQKYFAKARNILEQYTLEKRIHDALVEGVDLLEKRKQ